MADNLTLGRGKVFFAPYLKGAVTGGQKYHMGNAPTFSLSQTAQSLDHYNSEAGLKVLDRTVVLSEDMAVAFTLDDINLGNMTLWFGGDTSGVDPADAPTDIGDLQIIGKSQSMYGGLYFEADNPEGDNNNYWFPYVNLQPNGNVDLIGDNWQTMGFNARVLKRDVLTERVYVYQLSGGASAAASDTSPKLTPMTAGAVGATIATSGTVTAATPQVHAVPFNATFTLTGGTAAYAYLHDGTSIVGTGDIVTGASGSIIGLTAPASGTYTVKLYKNSDGSGSAIGTSSSITVS